MRRHSCALAFPNLGLLPKAARSLRPLPQFTTNPGGKSLYPVRNISDLKRKLSGEGPIAEGPTTPHLPRPRPTRLPKPVGFNAGFPNKKPQGHFCIRLPPTPGMIQGGRNGWGLPHIRLGRAPSLAVAQLAQPTECPSQPHSRPLFIRWGWHPPRLRGLPGSVPHLREVPTWGRSKTSPHPHVLNALWALEPPLNRLYLPFFLC